MPWLLVATLVVMLMPAFVSAEDGPEAHCVTTEGIAAIRGSEAAAREEALSRAKWRAMEKVSGVDLKAKTVLQSFRLLDQAITKQARGVIRSAEVQEGHRAPDGYHVTARVCVEPRRIEQAVSLLQSNTGVIVFIVSKRPEVSAASEQGGRASIQYDRRLEEMNPVSERLIDDLVQRKFSVFDPVASGETPSGQLAAAFKDNDLVAVRSLLWRLPARFIVFGEIESTFSQMKGSDIGFGVTMPGYSVKVALRFRLLLREESGRLRIIGSGTIDDRGIAAGPEDAYEAAMENLAVSAVPEIEAKIAREVKGLARPVRLIVEGVPNLDAVYALKDRLQLIPWVERVEEDGEGGFTIYYPDKTLYLASSISHVDRLEVRSIDRQSIEAIYR